MPIEQYPYFPQFSTYLPPLDPSVPGKPQAAPVMPAPETPATGTGNWFTSGLAAGGYGAVSEFSRALQAAAQFVGAPGAAQTLGDFAQRMHEGERSYARPDLEENPWSLPGIGYQIARMVPVGAATVGGALLGAATAPEVAAGAGAAALAAGARAAAIRGLAGAAGATYPFVTGENVQRQISETGQLTTPGKALAYGVPEAIVQGYLPARLESFFGKGVLRGIAGSAATQGVAGGATEFLTQQLGDPNRDMADRAAAVAHSALGGAALGGILGGTFGGIRALVGKPAEHVTTENLDEATKPLALPPPRRETAQREVDAAEAARAQETAPPVKGAPPLEGVPPIELWQRFDKVQEALRINPADAEALDASRLLGQEFTRRSAEMEPAPAVPEPPRQLTYQPGETPIEMRGPVQELPTGEIAGRIDVLRGYPPEPPKTQAAAEELRQLQQELQQRQAEAASAAATAPEPQKLLPPPATKETMPLQDMSTTDLMDRFHFVQSWLNTNPEDVRAQRASEVLGQEFSRRMEAATKAEPPAAEAPPPVLPATEAPPVAPAAPEVAAPAAPALNFTARLTESAFKKGMKAFDAATEDQQGDIRSQFIDAVLARGGKALTAPLKKWGKALDVLTEDGKELRDEFIPERAPEAPPGVEPEVPAEPPVEPVPAEPPVEPAPPPASVAPIKTVEDRAATLDSVASHIETLPDSPAKDKLVAEAQTVMKLLPNVETNPGLGLSLNVRLTRLRNQVEAAAQRPADAVASPDLTPSPTAEAKPAPTGDLDARLTTAQRALNDLRRTLKGRPDAVAALDQHEQWLANARKADPQDLQKLLAANPEADIEADNLGGLTQISKPMRAKVDAYLGAQEKVLQEVRAQNDSRARVISSREGLPVTQLDADVTDMHQRGVPLRDVADHIIEHVADPEQAEIVAKLRDFLPENAKTVFRDGVTDKEGEYFTKQKTSALYNAADATTTSIHEMAHAVMHRALEGDSAAAKAMRGIYDQLKNKGDHAGITDAHEMVSEAMANPTYREFLKSQIVRGTSLWDRMIDTLRGFIGLDPRLFNAFDRIMSHGDDLMKEQRAYPNEWLGPDSYARVTNKATGTAATAADEADRSLSEKLFNGSLNVRNFVRGAWNGWSPGQWLARNPEYNKLSENMQKYVDSLGAEDPRKKQIGKAAIVADRLSKALPVEAQESLKQGMAMTTSYGFHPEERIETYIDDIKDNPTRIRQFQAVKNWWNEAGSMPGVREAYDTWRSVMSMLGHASAVHNLQATERAAGVAADDAFRRFDVRGDLTNQPKEGAKFWQTELNNRVAANKEALKKLTADKAGVDTKLSEIEFKKDYPKELVKQQADLGSQIDRLGAGIKLAEAEQKRMLKEPYFHLGRKGDYFATGKLVTQPGAIDEETGKPGKPVVDQDVLSRFADHLQKNGVNDVAIMQGNQHGTFYTRVETPAQLGALYKVLGEAQKAGLLSKEDLASGKIFDPHIFNRVATQATQDVIERLRANRPVAPVDADPSLQPALDEAHRKSIQDLQRTLLSMTPETSMNRLMAHRQNVQGFNKDMVQSQGYAADVSAFSLARRSLAHEVSAAEAGMLKDVEKANGRADVDLNTKLGLADTIGELMRGQRLRQTYVPDDWKSAARQYTNFLHIGMSPAYVPMQLSQLAMTGAPELAKLSGSGLAGYGPAFMAMQRALAPTTKALAATIRSPDGLTAGITLEGLQKSGLTPAQVNTIMGMELRGSLGTYTASVSEHPALTGTMLKAANTLGMYADLAPRMIMGLAADEIYSAKGHPTLSREQFIDRAIGDSQGYYSAALGARQMGRGGLLGSYTPMTMQFQTWNINLTNKLYHEVHDYFKGDAQTSKDARTWLLGHAAATTMLAGTLGLPAVSVMASVYDKLMDLVTNRDDHDITASYRNFLAHTFGKDMGEIIARGLPRAAGVDFANWGEGEIIPGTASLKIFTEKRKWEDVEKDWFKSIGGPAADQIFQLFKAGGDIMNGDYLEGLGRMAPGLISGPMKAYKLSTQGFVDQHGQKLPLSSPNAAQIMLTALGLKPAGQAEYQEVSREVAGLRAMRQASSANISQHLRQAYTQGDVSAFNTWMTEAQRWQVQHPGFLPPQATFGQTLNNHIRQLAEAKGTGLPIGVRPQDIGPRGALEYANIPVQ